MTLTPKTELDNRISRLQTLLQDKGIDGALVVHSIDVYYFSGTLQSSHLYIPAQGKALLMTRKSFERAQQESNLDNIVPLTSVKNLPALIQETGLPLPKTLGLELDVLPVNNYLQYTKLFPETTLVDVSGLIKQVRLVKSGYELDLLREAAEIMNRVHRQAPGAIKQGMTELELASAVEAIARREGHEGFVRMRAFNQELYYGHLLSGANAAVSSFFDGPTGGIGLSPAYPHSASNRVIENNRPIIVDYVGVKNGYIVDLTRVYSIGSLPEKLVSAFEGTLAIQEEVLSAVRPGADCGALYELAVNKARELSLEDHFMGYTPNQAKFVAHGVGLELDEIPVMAKGVKAVLAAGMVFALEPKFVFPGEGVVGIENTFVVTDNGAERLTTIKDDIVIL